MKKWNFIVIFPLLMVMVNCVTTQTNSENTSGNTPLYSVRERSQSGVLGTTTTYKFRLSDPWISSSRWDLEGNWLEVHIYPDGDPIGKISYWFTSETTIERRFPSMFEFKIDNYYFIVPIPGGRKNIRSSIPISIDILNKLRACSSFVFDFGPGGNITLSSEGIQAMQNFLARFDEIDLVGNPLTTPFIIVP